MTLKTELSAVRERQSKATHRRWEFCPACSPEGGDVSRLLLACEIIAAALGETRMYASTRNLSIDALAKATAILQGEKP